MKKIALLLLVFTAVVVFGCNELFEKEKTGNLSGVTIDLYTGEPLKDITYGISNDEKSFQDVTNELGFFEIENIPIGHYEVFALRMQGTYSAYVDEIYISEGDNYTEAKLRHISLPAGGVVDYEVLDYSENYVKFKIDFFVADGAEMATEISSDDIDIEDSTFPSGNHYDFTKKDVYKSYLSSQGAYSANLTLDQSGSISSTDPTNSRLEATKMFCSHLGSSDYVYLTAFASGGLLPYDITGYGSFTNDGKTYFSTIESLSQKIDGGTPLFKAASAAVSTVYEEGLTENKAVVLFTDGEDTDGGLTIEDVVNQAIDKNVRIFTVGLGGGTNGTVLSRLAKETGGAYVEVYDATELISIFGTLGNILDGTAKIYSGEWYVHTSNNSFPGWFETSITVNYKGEKVYIPFHIDVPTSKKAENGIHNTHITKQIIKD